MGTKKIKIVCIVNNDVEISKGLYNAFGNNYSYNKFVTKYLYTGNEKIIGKSNNNFLLISDNNEPQLKKEISETDTWDIIFAIDNYKKSIGDYPPYLFSPETLVMYHRTPLDSKPQLLDMQSKKTIMACKEGSHIYDFTEGYTRLTKLIDDKVWDFDNKKIIINEYDEAFNNIIEWFGLNNNLSVVAEFIRKSLEGTPAKAKYLTDKLSIVAEFIHKSLEGTPAKAKILTDNGFDLNKKVNGEKTLQILIDALKPGAGYNKSLVNVRDALLKEAGVITREN